MSKYKLLWRLDNTEAFQAIPALLVIYNQREVHVKRMSYKKKNKGEKVSRKGMK
jgi:hypothetical protein